MQGSRPCSDRRANPEFAVWGAIGQLLAYEFVFYEQPTNKVAPFSARVGDLWNQLLQRVGIDVVG